MGNRAELEAIIRRGESVKVGVGPNARFVSRIEDLPDDVELAAGDESLRAQIRERLIAQRAAIDVQIAELEKPAASTEPSTPTEPSMPPAGPTGPTGTAAPVGPAGVTPDRVTGTAPTPAQPSGQTTPAPSKGR